MSWNNGSSNKTLNSSRTKTTWFISRKRPTIQYNCYCPRISDNFLLSNARIYWRLRQLTTTSYTRSPRHSVPSTQQHKILTSSSIINTSPIISGRRKRSRHRMNCIPTSIIKSSTRWTICRLSHFLPPPSRSIIHPRGRKFHHYSNQYTNKRNTIRTNSPICMSCSNYCCPTTPILTSTSRSNYNTSNRSKP